ncbi:MAG TPA: polysaccharide deacetylase family protein, partial [Gammaproteobacteria bacterium]|nr:polysaccharide deacetylase family protein [Gammaproteobacteria bacterium]
MKRPLTIVVQCSDVHAARVRYVLDTLFMARGIPVIYASQRPVDGPWLYYGAQDGADLDSGRALILGYSPQAWDAAGARLEPDAATVVAGLPVLFESRDCLLFEHRAVVPFDIAANAFYFLASVAERVNAANTESRCLYSDSVFARLDLPMDIVDRYLRCVSKALDALCERMGVAPWPQRTWPDGASHAVVLSHDVDFIPAGRGDIVRQGAKTMARHLLRQRRPMDALRAGTGLFDALINDRDPYGCIPEIIAKERELGVRASFQVAVGHRHPVDVNYYIEDDCTRDYLRNILDNGFDLCLHGSYRSTEDPRWYTQEVALLSDRLAAPRGSRQHYLSFDYDTLFSVQERTGILYDMSMGYPDRLGTRPGFSFPYFPWNMTADRPYDVLELSLVLMDVTLQGYMNLPADEAWETIRASLEDLREKRGGYSVVWHPIVFGGARDPGYGDLFWKLVEHTREHGGIATDGEAINDFWRRDARTYSSFKALT